MNRFSFGILVSVLFVSIGTGTLEAQQERAEILAGAIGKIIRLEAEYHRSGQSMPSDLAEADSIFSYMVDKRTGKAGDFVQGEEVPQWNAIIDILAEYDDPRTDDPAGRIISALNESQLVGTQSKALLDAYGGEFQVVLDGHRALRTPLGLAEAMGLAGLPITLSDLGLDRADSAAVKNIAESAGEGSASERGSEAYLFYSTMLHLDDLGGKFANQQDEADMAERVITGAVYQELEDRLKALKPMTIVFFGDSQTDNRHWSSPAHYPKIIEEVFRRINPDVTIVNAGIGGDDSREGLERIQSDVLARDPDVCFVLFGGNDCAVWGGDTPTVLPDNYKANIETIVTRLKEQNCRPVLMSYPTIPAPAPNFGPKSARFLKQMNGHQQEVRNSKWTGWIGLAEEFNRRDPGRMFTVDKIHFTPEAHVLMTELILRYLVEKIGTENKDSGLESFYDFNGDGHFNVADALALHIRSSRTPELDLFDLDGNGTGDTDDVVALLRILAGDSPML